MGEPESDDGLKKHAKPKGSKGLNLLSIVEKIRDKKVPDIQDNEDQVQDNEVVVIEDDAEEIHQSHKKDDLEDAEKPVETENSDVEMPIVEMVSIPEELYAETPIVQILPEETDIETPIVQILPEETDIETPIVQILPEEIDIETPIVHVLPEETDIETPIVHVLPEEPYIETPVVQVLPEETDNEMPGVQIIQDETGAETPAVQILPEGADEEMTELNEIEGSQNESPNEDDLPEFVECTACGTRMKPSKRKLCKHPVLGVIICKRCSKFYNSSPFTRDELGMEEYCKWCAEGGKLICCDFCEKSFCRPCLRRNLGKEFLKVLLGAEQSMKWKCFVCDPSQLEAYKRECELVIKILDKLKLREYIFENKKTHLGGPSQLTRLERLHNITGCIEEGVDIKENLIQKIDLVPKVLSEGVTEQLNDNDEITSNGRSISSERVSKEKNISLALELKDKKKKNQQLKDSISDTLDTENDELQLVPKKEKPPPEVLEVSDDDEMSEVGLENEAISEAAEPDLVAQNGEGSSLEASDNVEDLVDSSYDVTKSLPGVILRDFTIALERIDIPVCSRSESKSSESVIILSSDDDQVDKALDKEISEDESNIEVVPKIEQISRSSKMTARKSSSKKVSNKLWQLRIRPSDGKNKTLEKKPSESNSEEGQNLSSSDSDIDLSKVRNRSIRRQAAEPVEQAAEPVEQQTAGVESPDDQVKKKQKIRKPKREPKREESDDEMSDNKDTDVKVEEMEEASNECEHSEKEMDTSELDSNDDAVDASDEIQQQGKMSKRIRKSKDSSLSEVDPDDVDNKRKSKRRRKNRSSSPLPSDDESEDGDGKEKKKGKGKGKQEEKGKKGKAGGKASEDNEAESGVENKRKTKRRWRNRASSPQSSADESEDGDDKGKKKAKGKGKGKQKGKKGKVEENSSEDNEAESDVESKRKPKRRRRNRATSSLSSDDESEDGDRKGKKKGKGKNKGKGKIKGKKKGKVVESSSEEDDDDDDVSPSKRKGRKKIRRILADDELTEETRHARQLEEDRRKRLLERTQTTDEIEAELAETNAFVLEKEKDTGKALVTVHPSLTEHLKPHQKEGIQFLYNAVVESVDNWKKGNGGGALLAHCMGLGKTLQVIAFAHTLYNHKEINLRNILVVAPLNTVLNWQVEFEKWLEVDERLDVYCLTDAGSSMWRRVDMLQDWMTYGGVMILGYEMYRNLSQHSRIKSKKQKKIITTALVDPGPELVICDEGHVLRNDQSAISKQLNNIKTLKRVVLTGTPLQNNLGEYHVMVSFVKPNLLGTRKEFQNRFVNPISNGQCSNSTPADVMVMKQRCHVLHEMLSGCVQRKDYTVLTPFLTPKHEFTIFVRLCDKQIKMYKKYIETFVCKSVSEIKSRGMSLFSDYQCLMRIWTHPWALKVEAIRRLERARYNDSDSIDEFINDSDTELSGDAKPGWKKDSDSSDFTTSKTKNKTKRKRKLTESDKSESSESSSEKEHISESSSSSEDSPKPNRSSKYPQRSSRSRNQEVAEVTKNKKVIKDNLSKRRVASMVLLDDSDVSDGAGDVKPEVTKKKENDDVVVVQPEVAKGTGNTRSGTVFKENTGDLPIDDNDEDKEWYDEFLQASDEYNVELSGKFVLLLEILADAEVVGDKVLVFSQSLVSLDLIESALGGGSIGGNDENWCKGVDYFRMDGSTPPQTRQRYSEIFNDPDNTTSRLFLISTRAGSLGINMVAANRVIIFDCSWNPSHDVQSVFRVYRFGQTKPCYVYRLISQGTMEEKIYDRQITKLAMAGRVVDEQQIERHFTDEQIRELYTFTPEEYNDAEERATPQLPKDPVLAEVLQRLHQKWIVRYHEHDLLLENLEQEQLTEEERKQAWSNYEAEKDSASRNLAKNQLDQERRAQLLEEYRRHSELQQQQERVRQQAVLQALIERQQQQVAMARLAQQQQQQQRVGAASFSGYRPNLGRPPMTPLSAHFGAMNTAAQEQLRQLLNNVNTRPAINPIDGRTGNNQLYRLKIEMPPRLGNPPLNGPPQYPPGTVVRVQDSRLQGRPQGVRFPLSTSTYIPPRP